MKVRTVIGWLLLLALPCSLLAQTKDVSETAGARDFVQAFYNWYVPQALKDNATPAWNLALKYKSPVFNSEVLSALREDSAAQAKVAGDIVGLDFDPFLSSQDPSARYDVGKVTIKGGACWVEIHGVRPGKKSAAPDVTAELSHRDGRWIFVNFHYADGGDLLSVLKTLRDDRQKNPE